MKTTAIRTFALTIAGVLLLQTAALAGPPLICHPFNIGDARSLPFQGPAWSQVDASYDIRHLLDDTVALLTPGTPVIVRMETLRRATLYSRQDAKLAAALFDRIRERADRFPSDSREREAVLARFDLGYLAETYAQAVKVSNFSESHWKFAQVDPKIDGYALVMKSIAQGGGPQMEFAAAVIASDKQTGTYKAHVQNALSSARSDAMLERNLAIVFPDASKMAGLK